MFIGYGWAEWLTFGLAAFFIATGFVNFTGPAGMRRGFEEWGFPNWWHYVNGTVLLATGMLLIILPTRLVGFGLGLLECLAIYITLLRHRAYGHLPPSVLLLAALALAYMGLYGAELPLSSLA